MSQRLRPCLLALLALTLVGSFAWGQAYPCTTSGGTNCRAIIPDQGPPPVPLDSVINVVASGACATLPTSRVSLDVAVRHDWRPEVGIQLTSPGAVTATLKSAAPASGINYPEEDYEQFHLAPSLVGGSAAGAWTLSLTDIDNSGYGALDDWTLYLICGPIPSVTIVASDPLAIENPLSTGAFTVTRSVVTTEALDVPLLITGTAAAGDYQALPVIATIPANQASVQVLVTPIPDALTEVSETVIATVDASGLYSVGAPSAATVTIYDQPLQEIPALGHAGFAALAALLAAGGVWLLRSRQG
jgi:subtilisin-like proprotein convertase family protein